MMPLVVTVLPEMNRVVGTFDLDSFESWWISDPFPGSVETVLDLVRVHGEYYFALCRMTDGSWTVFRSNNYGRSWSEIWTHPHEIFGFISIDWGWVVFPAADGWYETTTTGNSILKKSDAGPASLPGKGMPVTEDRVLYHSGSKVWATEDRAESWDLSFDGTSIWSGDSSPAIAGGYSLVLAGIGPYLLRSETQGGSWEVARKLTNDRIIREILAINPSAGAAAEFVVKVELVGQDKFRYYTVTGRGEVWTPRWDRLYSAGVTLAGYESTVPVVGGMDYLQFAGGMKFDSVLGRPVPSLKFSRNGVDWTTIDLEKTHTSPTTPFLVSTYTWKVITGPPCHHTYVYYTRYRWGVSWSMRFTARKEFKLSSFGARALAVDWVPESLDGSVLVKKAFPVPMSMNVPMQKAIPVLWHVRPFLQGTVPEGVDCDSILVHQQTETIPASCRVCKTLRVGAQGHVAVRGRSSRGVSVGAFFVRSLFDSMLVDAEHYFPQWWNLHCPPRPWRVFNSKKERYD